MSSPLLPPAFFNPRMDRDLEICILAGGVGSRLGGGKPAVRLGRRTLLGHVRANAAAAGLPVRVLKTDLVPRCGPLGGIYSGLKTSRQRAVLFLACDMPFVSPPVLRRIIKQFDGTNALVTIARGKPGFPLVLPAALLATVERLIARRHLSIRGLASSTRARFVRASAAALFNVNTPEDLVHAKRRLVSAQEQLVKRH
jgi:molybdenum cofactor guanylyltransferase